MWKCWEETVNLLVKSLSFRSNVRFISCQLFRKTDFLKLSLYILNLNEIDNKHRRQRDKGFFFNIFNLLFKSHLNSWALWSNVLLLMYFYDSQLNKTLDLEWLLISFILSAFYTMTCGDSEQCCHTWRGEGYFKLLHVKAI